MLAPLLLAKIKSPREGEKIAKIAIRDRLYVDLLIQMENLFSILLLVG